MGLIKDIFGLFIIITLYTIQLYFGIFSLSHPDNAFQVIELVTPLHIVPEWYFLLYYAMLKAIPNKNAGFIILLTSILILLLFGESHFHPRSLNCCFLSNNNMFSLDRCSITSRNIYILWSYLDIILL